MAMMSLPCLCGNVLKFEFSGGDVRGCPISVQSTKRLGTQQKSEMPNADEVILVTKDISYFPKNTDFYLSRLSRVLFSISLNWRMSTLKTMENMFLNEVFLNEMNLFYHHEMS